MGSIQHWLTTGLARPDFMQAEPGHLERRHAQGTLAAFGQALLDRHGIQISQERR